MTDKKTCADCPWQYPHPMKCVEGSQFVCQLGGAIHFDGDSECPARRSFRVLRDAYRLSTVLKRELSYQAELEAERANAAENRIKHLEGILEATFGKVPPRKEKP